MNPADFIALAVKLSNSQQEVDLRTAVSRAYYGAFHSARELLEECGIGFPAKEAFGAAIHTKVRYCLANAGNTDARKATNKLGALRSQRNSADYDLKSDHFSVSHGNAVKVNVRIAIEIVDALQRCRGEIALPDFREKVRAYARDVLRLPVQGE